MDTMQSVLLAADSVELTGDICTSIFLRLNSATLSRAAAVCKSWAAFVQEDSLWKCVCEVEFGGDCMSTTPHNWRQRFLDWQASASGQHAANKAKFAAAVGQVSEWQLTLQPTSRDPQAVHGLPPADAQQTVTHQLQAQKVMVNPQSIWITFNLPPVATFITPDGKPLPWGLEVRALFPDSSHTVLISSPKFLFPMTDMDRMMQSHQEGLYAWAPDSDDSDDEGGGGEEAPRPATDRKHPHMVAYIHYEQLLPLWTKRLPQCLPIRQRSSEPPASTVSEDPIEYPSMHLFIDFANIRTGKVLGSCHAVMVEPLHATACMECPGRCRCLWTAGYMVKDGNGWPGDVEVLGGQAIPGSDPEVGSSAGSGSDDSSAAARIQRMLEDECLIDFALLYDCGQLVIGRCGVEIWREVETVVDSFDRADEFEAAVYRASFLVDGIDSRLRVNSIYFRPAQRRLEMQLSERAMAQLLGLGYAGQNLIMPKLT